MMTLMTKADIEKFLKINISAPIWAAKRRELSYLAEGLWYKWEILRELIKKYSEDTNYRPGKEIHYGSVEFVKSEDLQLLAYKKKVPLKIRNLIKNEKMELAVHFDKPNAILFIDPHSFKETGEIVSGLNMTNIFIKKPH